MEESTIREFKKEGYDRRYFQVGFAGFDTYPESNVEKPLSKYENPLNKLRESVTNALQIKKKTDIGYSKKSNSQRNAEISKSLQNLNQIYNITNPPIVLPEDNGGDKLENSPLNVESKLSKKDDKTLFSDKQGFMSNRDKNNNWYDSRHFSDLDRGFLDHHQKSLFDWFELTFSGRKDVKKVITGGYHYFVLMNDGLLYSCGWNKFLIS